MKDVDVFGNTGEGGAVHRIALSGGGLSVGILDWGATVQDLRLAGHDAPLVLGFDDFQSYLDSTAYFGAIVGRFANRIARGRFFVDGRHHQADTNFLARHTLHGGGRGIDKRSWQIAAHGSDFVTLTLRDGDGEMGFPGNLDITCTYRLKLPATLGVELIATCDAPTLCNLAHHSYFNLDDGGSGSILDHRLAISAGAYLPVDGELIPTGAVLPVEDTDFDFLIARPVRLEKDGRLTAYDHNFCLAASRGPLRRAAWVQGARSGVEMEVWTTEPGLQLFDGHALASERRGLGGRTYGPHSGMALEPQLWPDAPNRPYFPQAELWPGDRYRQVTEYRFRLP